MNFRPALAVVLVLSALLNGCGSQKDRAEGHTLRAQEFYEQGDYVTAKIEALNATQIEPRSLEARLILARIEEELGDHGAAIGHLQVAVETDPSRIETRLKLGNYYVLARMTKEASDQAEAALKLAPNSAEAHLLNGRVYYLNDEEYEAKQEVERALQLDPTLVAAIIFKVGFQHNAGDMDGALQAVDEGITAFNLEQGRELREFRVRLLRAAKRNDEVEADLIALMQDFPDNENYPLSLANLYSLDGRMDEAEQMLRSVIEKYPKDFDHIIELVRFITERRGPEEAIGVLDEFIIESPDELKLRLTLGRLHEVAGAPDRALAVYGEIASISPASEEGLSARNRIAIIKIDQGDIDGVRDLIDEILADEKDNSDALLARAAFHMSEKSYDDAISDLRIVLRSGRQTERALLLLARAHIGEGSLSLAQDAYRRLIETDPDHPFAANELAEMLANIGAIEMASDVLTEHLKVKPEDINAASALVQAFLIQGELDAAEKAARKMVALEDESGLAEFQLGQVLEARESYPDAITAYGLSLQKNPDAPPSIESLVRVLVNLERTDEAIEYLKQRLEDDPSQVFSKYLLGAIYVQEGQTEMAKVLLKEVVIEQSDSVRAHQLLASLYPEDLDTTILIYERGFNSNRDSENLGLLLATEYHKAGEHEKAISTFEQVLAVNPENVRAANNLASALLDYRSDQESYARALKIAKRFEDSDQPALLDTLGWAYYQNEDFKRARQYLEKAIKPGNQPPLVHHHLGMAYFAEEDLLPARRQLKKAITLAEGDYSKADEANETLDAILDQMKPR